MFKINNNISIVNFEQVNIFWAAIKSSVFMNIL